MKYEEIITTLSNKTGIPYEVVDLAYKSYWKFVRDKIQELPLKDNISEEEMRTLKTNFNVPSLGKLSCTPERFFRVKKRLDYIKKFREKYDKYKES